VLVDLSVALATHPGRGNAVAFVLVGLSVALATHPGRGSAIAFALAGGSVGLATHPRRVADTQGTRVIASRRSKRVMA